MPRFHYACVVVPALVVLAGCGHDEQPRTTQVIVQPQQPQQMAVVAPNPPPPLRSEMVPPPPPGVGPVVWQPGHWMLSGNTWAWQPGQYVPPPPGETTWVPGHWAQQPGGAGWVWLEGHWA
jgi:WXXGXW repeat (2 copies)